MSVQPVSPLLARETAFDYVALRASEYSSKQLAEIYNDTRVDYIVPMPMNERRMAEYIAHYDIDLASSVVLLNGERDVAGLAMLARRGQRAWITRLGVVPARRGRRMGQFMMEVLLCEAVAQGVQQVQLEVIVGNAPAYSLFRKFGFEETRELLVLRRPPAPVVPEPTALFHPLDSQQALSHLEARAPVASWIDETESLRNIGHIEGLRVALGADKIGWATYRNTPFQLSHIVLSAYDDPEMAAALLSRVHARHPSQDTKLENLPAACGALPAFEALGYHETFRRIEMIRAL